MQFHTCTRQTLDRNLKSGKWVALSALKDGTCLVKIVDKGPGTDNPAGRIICMQIPLTKKQQASQVAMGSAADILRRIRKA